MHQSSIFPGSMSQPLLAAHHRRLKHHDHRPPATTVRVWQRLPDLFMLSAGGRVRITTCATSCCQALQPAALVSSVHTTGNQETQQMYLQLLCGVTLLACTVAGAAGNVWNAILPIHHVARASSADLLASSRSRAVTPCVTGGEKASLLESKGHVQNPSVS